MATLVVHTVSLRTRFVSVDLELMDRAPATVQEARAIASRHLSGDALEANLQFAEDHLGEEERFTFTPTRYRFADLRMRAPRVRGQQISGSWRCTSERLR
ncbi:hypothetical protein [Serinicoccus marinus]|uniref:hypothetical protein n=1 Tax=Serinicoccus marinus TaxID=247333 RepID=UPI0003B4F9A7|nr:hypothetical protein [Serinicoccus marinus]